MNGDISEEASGYDLYAALVLSNMLDTEQDLIEKKEKELELEQQQQQQDQEDSPTSSLEETNHDVIWVPADKHPEIAPNEFANFIKTHGANTPTRRASSLHRRKSILSQSLTSSSSARYSHDEDEDEEAELNRTLSEKKRIFLQKVMTENKQLKDTNFNTQVFDRNSTSNDDSRIIAPRSDRSLLRRSAFSARGRNRKTHGSLDNREQAMKRRSVSQRKPSSATVSTLNDEVASLTSQSTARSWDKSEGISLFDQPVNMSEWIDLGSASLESDDSQRGILTRVHDAESQLRSQLDVASNDKMDENEHLQHQQQFEETKEENVAKDTESPPMAQLLPAKEIDHSAVETQTTDANVDLEDTQSSNAKSSLTPPATSTAPKHRLETPKRPGIIRSETETNRIPMTVAATKPEKRSSWLGGLFNDKKNSKSNGKKEPISTTVINNNTSSPLSGLASLFSRSLSMKSNLQSNTNSSQSHAGKLKSKNKINNTTNPTLPYNTINAKHPNLNNNVTTTINDTTKPSITTNITTTPTIITNNNSNKKKRSSRLEIPPPSERTFFNSNRLPLHVERAIYRLSHMKLADPRRPLQQQVLISNLMFWYLSIQQNDFQRAAEQRIETESPPVPDTQQKKGGKMSRLIHSAKKRRNEVAQFVQAYPLSGTHHDISNSSSSASSISSTTSNNSTRPSLKHSNVQFSLPPIPSHHHTINVHGDDSDDEDDTEEEDDLPLSHYKS
ncbi:uncharacterized protein ATC70_004288 [Mucor velutinosus]|uniref:Protein Zds1 C-terminal domain-containing protein n=1 Tax=Mucor velutinosus TaxID=708070 RepID=A0AAN7I493_9FUNG|nr:hypothetical protein ATC70_004288 [Mucor velutinosus]